MPAAFYAKYDTTTGRIAAVLSCDEGLIDIQPLEPGEAFTMIPENIDDLSHYVDGEGEAIERPILAFSKLEIVADGADTAVLSDLPDPCKVWVNGEALQVTGGSLELAADVPATYSVLIEERDAFPYLRFEEEVVAT